MMFFTVSSFSRFMLIAAILSKLFSLIASFLLLKTSVPMTFDDQYDRRLSFLGFMCICYDCFHYARYIHPLLDRRHRVERLHTLVKSCLRLGSGSFVLSGMFCHYCVSCSFVVLHFVL